jgi:hypothetical protein
VALSASGRPIHDQRNFVARMLDRLMQLIPRLAATDDQRHPSIESFRDLRIAFNALDLCHLRMKLGGEASASIGHVLDGVRGHFEKCIERRARQPVPESLMSSIDTAVERVTGQGRINTGNTAEARAPLTAEAPSTTEASSAPTAPATATTSPAPSVAATASARQSRDAVHALIGLRLSLFPATLTHKSPLKAEPAA